MRLAHRRIRGWFYLGMLPLLLLGFSSHSLKPNGKLLHSRMPHRTYRVASRTGEACVVDHVEGDRQQAAVVSLPAVHERPKSPATNATLAALPAAPLAAFADRHLPMLARGELESQPSWSLFDPRSPRGPPSLS